ncbi:Calx-beta domain-containing protein [Candidatus Poriferisocius sp.]|uniref:Calx-beta domain-containing protein n=1 Tax=Candidatus Poriferisocius sp. TaxID=3101276 RepID=UPI003B023C09
MVVTPVVSISAGSGVAVADDDDPPPPQTTAAITVEDASGPEGGKVVFRVTLSEASSHEVAVNWVPMTAWHLMDARAHSTDYFYGGGTLVFAPGETAKTAEVWLRQDSDDEPDEYFAVEAHFPDRFFESRTQGTMTIIDDD